MARELAEAVEFIPRRLYWVSLHSPSLPKTAAPKTHFFSTDRELVYEPFFADFGPLNLGCTYRYCRLLDAKLQDPLLADHKIVHYCSHDPKLRANAAYLICAYFVIVQRKSADVAFAPFGGIYPPFHPFRDASATCICSFNLTILDCLRGLEKSIESRLFDWEKFDVDSYDFFEKVENGDINWILPNKFLAFAGPCPTSTDPDGFPAFTPEDYVPIFLDAGVQIVVRLNRKRYDKRRFVDHGIKHVDLYFVDGSCPSRDIINKFLHITESEPGACAVHCKAGLGRTGTLIGLYAMKHFQFPARAFIGWNRICRPGSILGPQQQFLVDMQQGMFQAGALLRWPAGLPSVEAELELARKMGGLSIREPTREEQVEDVGQGDRLLAARRGGSPMSPAARAHGDDVARRGAARNARPLAVDYTVG